MHKNVFLGLMIVVCTIVRTVFRGVGALEITTFPSMRVHFFCYFVEICMIYLHMSKKMSTFAAAKVKQYYDHFIT